MDRLRGHTIRAHSGAGALWTAAQLKINLSGKEPIVRTGQGFDLFTGQADIQLTHMAALSDLILPISWLLYKAEPEQSQMIHWGREDNVRDPSESVRERSVNS